MTTSRLHLRLGRRSRAAGKRILLAVFLFMFSTSVALGLWVAAGFWRWGSAWAAASPGRVAVLGVGALLVFAYGYLGGVLLWRLIVPRPRAGVFRAREDGRPGRGQVIFMFNILVALLRYKAPWSGSLLAVLTQLPPVAGLYRRLFCPHHHAVTMGDTNQILDPYLLQTHPTAQIGFGGIMTCHLFTERGLVIKPIRIDEYAFIGGHVMIAPGVHVGMHSVVEVGSMVAPGTCIPPYEQWGGAPARKVRDLPRPNPG